MSDLKPPRFASDERATLQELWQYHRESLVRKVTGIDDDMARRRFVPTDTTLLWLAKHAAGTEMRWVLWSFAGMVDSVRDDAIDAGDTLQAVVDEYRDTWARTDAVVAAASFDEECQVVFGGFETVNLRWIVTHLVAETARHAGHADILRELTDGRTGR